MPDETVGKSLADIHNEPKLTVTKIKEPYLDYVMYEFKFTYPSGEFSAFKIEGKVYELMKEHFCKGKPRLTVK